MMPPLPEVSIPCTTRRSDRLPSTLDSAYRRSCSPLTSSLIADSALLPAALLPRNAGLACASSRARLKPALTLRASENGAADPPAFTSAVWDRLLDFFAMAASCHRAAREQAVGHVGCVGHHRL